MKKPIRRLLPALSALAVLPALGALAVLTAALPSQALAAGAAPQERQPSATVSASVYSDDAAARYDWSFSPAYADEASGRSYYTAYAYETGRYLPLIRQVYQDREGSWHALEPDVVSYWDGVAGEPRLALTGMYNRTTPLVGRYDPARDRAGVSASFSEGATGMTMLRIESYKKLQDGISTSVSYKLYYRSPKGLVREIGDYGWSSGFFPLPDGGMIGEAYNARSKRIEVLRIDPRTGNPSHVAFACLQAYDPKSNRALLLLNEPGRPGSVLDLKDGSRRPASDKDLREIRSPIQPGTSYQNPAPPAEPPPAGLQPQELPVTATTLDVEPVARAFIAPGISVDLSFAFIRGGRTLLPARELIETAGLHVEAHRVPGKGGSENWFELTGPAGTVRADSATSQLLGDRLYVSSALLAEIGLPVERIDWLPPSAD
ncbi:hypothetical protein B8V81_0747 [Paenibacillus pasadenensis]|uniref:Uncharacterized protein n=1 Tax=Paenibacillus pasadenensis TaxID=217090 RepID=A0A2N5NC52_9BACL|nr:MULTISPECIES: hypothetical protein [Paenibacillus]PLT47840.1 hypothetical protein B8V81_0747 [Paenibacillus pasadenensis]QGG58005.1 hypothetical protein GE073_22145 [Paenibacillus sp. B01]